MKTENYDRYGIRFVAFSPESGGTLRGKEAVAQYWAAALEKFSNLNFVLENVFIGCLMALAAVMLFNMKK